jgi:hypothetical protein
MARYIKYIGTSHVRQITAEEWAALDPPVENVTVRWNRAHGWTVPADMISEAAWPYIEADEELVLVDRDFRGLATDDTAEADPVMYPPLTTGQQAELMGDQRPDAEPVTEEPPADQHTGSVSVNRE